MINKVIKAAKLGGEQINKFFGETIEVFSKSTIADFRTEADLASEKAILDKLQKHFPDFNYFAEESGWVKTGSEYTFIIDPLDGTNNFSLGIPSFSVSIALQKNDVTILGVVYNPILDELFYAEKDKGAFKNEVKMKVNDTREITKATISYACGYEENGVIYEHIVKAINTFKAKRLITNWSPALDYCLLASGKIESIICKGTDICDNMAGKLIVREAGGIITEFDGTEEKDEENTHFIASNNKELHNIMLGMYQQIEGMRE
jgi:myo-inositol-1(or 4)-monophosphatase